MVVSYVYIYIILGKLLCIHAYCAAIYMEITGNTWWNKQSKIKQSGGFS